MRTRPAHQVPEALRRHNEEQDGANAMTIRRSGSISSVMLPYESSYEAVKSRWGGGAHRIQLFGAWDRARRQEKYIRQVAFWIWKRFPPTPALLDRLRRAEGIPFK